MKQGKALENQPKKTLVRLQWIDGKALSLKAYASGFWGSKERTFRVVLTASSHFPELIQALAVFISALVDMSILDS